MSNVQRCNHLLFNFYVLVTLLIEHRLSNTDIYWTTHT